MQQGGMTTAAAREEWKKMLGRSRNQSKRKQRCSCVILSMTGEATENQLGVWIEPP